MEVLSVLALGNVKEEGDDPATDGKKEHNTGIQNFYFN